MSRARAGVAALLALVACRAPSFDPYEEAPGIYDRFTPLQLEALVQADELFVRGQVEVARRYLASLAAAAPDNLVVATRLQEVELQLLADGLTVPGVALGEEQLDPASRLRPLYMRRALVEGTASAYVLAARLASEEEAAIGLLDEALRRDPDCVWAHYAFAWHHAAAQRFGEAQSALERALALDPGHPPSRRLEAALLARSGDVERATRAHRFWLERYGDDPRTSRRHAADARLDLAALLVLGEEPEEALDELAAIDRGELSDATSLELVRATALQVAGRVSAALAVARAAAAAAPDDVRPRQQEAILLGEHLGDEQAAREAWEAVLSLLDGPEDSAGGASESADPAARELATLLLQLQARTALARLGAAPAEDAPETAPAPGPPGDGEPR
ncbi:MAG: tetratricopeptide repeat protein [Planctomycetota bacterium]